MALMPIATIPLSPEEIDGLIEAAQYRLSALVSGLDNRLTTDKGRELIMDQCAILSRACHRLESMKHT